MCIDLFVGGVEDSLPETAPSKSLAPHRRWAYPMLTQHQKS
jgi:hypothetical protein